MSVRATPGLLERDGELDELQAALEDARGGAGRLVVVEGPAGIGKTRLLEAARDRAEQAGLRVLSARGTELERAFPFALVRQLFESVLHEASGPDRDELLDEAARPAGPIVGIDSARSPGDEDAGFISDVPFEVLNGLYWLTSNLSERGSVLLAVDDVQWSDQASLRFLMFLLPRLGDLPVTLGISVRSREVGVESELLDRLRSDPAALVLHPAPLGGTSVAELVRAELADDADDAFCAACEAVSGGNPFMLHELLRELRAEESQGTQAEASRVRELAPASIQRAVLARLARMPDECRELARAIAVLGDDAEPREAAALAGLDARATADAADALAAAGTLEAGRPLRFAHPLLRNAVYADLTGAEKVAFHRRAADNLTTAGAGPERIAVHLLATDPDGDPQVVETLGGAAQRALEHGAPEAAISYLQRALAEPPEPSRRPDLLRTLMTASFDSMDQSALARLDADRVEELTADPEALYAVASELAPLLLVSGRTEEGMALLDRARATSIQAGDYDRVVSFDAQVAIWADLGPKKDPAWDRYADRLPDDTPGGRVRLALKAYSGARSSEPAGSVSDWALRAMEGGAIFREQRDSTIAVLPIWVLIRTDLLDDAERAIERFSRVARARGPAPVIVSLFLRGSLAYARGEIALAEPDMRDAVEGARQFEFVGMTSDWVGLLIEMLIERGELERAEHALEAGGLDGRIPDKIGFSQALHARGCLRLAQGRTAEGLDDLTELPKRLERHGWSNPLYPTDAVAAVALAGAGQTEAARATADRYRRAAERWGTPRANGIALRCQGVVEGGDRGMKYLWDAVAMLRRSPARLELARALADLGAALRRANQRSDAREPLREALEIARRDGALAIAQRAHDELEATGEKLRPLLADGVESLTPSELRVAGMAAEGKTNRAIAQDLFLTVKTIEAHLSSAYRKLDIASRSELPEALNAAPT
jgi:ATP/maltotriose-dependent transcriptional regulator MalT